MRKDITAPNQKIYGYLFRKRLLKVILAVLLVFLILLGVLFYFFEQSSYRDNIKKNTDNIIFQIAATSEIAFRNIKDSMNRTVLYDTSAFTLSTIERETRAGKVEILDMLKSLSIANEHIHSSYLYYLENDLIYTSQSAPSAIVPFSAFNDSFAYSKLGEKDSYALPPRLLVTRSQRLSNNQLPLAVTLVTGAPVSSLSKASYLAVNVDVEGLFSTLFRKMQIDESMNFYVLTKDALNPEGDLTVIYHKDRNKIFSTMPHPSTIHPQKNVYVSTYYSDILDWEFVIENHAAPLRPDVAKQFSLLFLFLFIIFIVMILLLIFYTVPINRMLSSAQNSHWRELLTSNHSDRIDFAEEIMQFSTGESFSKYSRYGVVAIMSSSKDTLLRSQSLKINEIADTLFENKDLFTYQMVMVHSQQIVVVVGFNEKENTACLSELQLLAYEIIDNFSVDLFGEVTCCLSAIKTEINLLPLAYKEALSAAEYRYLLHSSVLLYTKIQFSSTPYVFPAEQERQLINNLVVGNAEGCQRFLDKIFLSFEEAPYTLRDEEINRYRYLLYNAILRQLMSLPMSIHPPYEIDAQNHSTLADLRQELDGFIGSVIEKINAQGGDDSLVLGNSILGYMNSNFTDSTIDLGTISEEFSLNKNYVSKIINEITGKSFPEYMNDARIEASKRLLETTDKTVKEIAEDVGFTYSYYFIRVFKQSQGITPGEYKKISKDILP